MRCRISICTFLLAPGMLLAAGLAAADPDNTFHEDFSTHDHADLVQTTAIWDLGTGSVYPPAFSFDQLGSYDTAGSARHIDVEGDLAYVVDFSGGLVVLDITTPSNPVPVGSLPLPGYASDLVVEGDLALIGCGAEGLILVDVSDPTKPAVLGTHDTADNAYGVAVVGDVAYVAVYGSGLEVVDISDPTAPVLIGAHGGVLYLTSAYDVAVAGDLVYMGAAIGAVQGLQVIDVSDPTDPTRIATAPAGTGAILGVAVAGDVAYLAEGPSGLYAFDISDPDTPVLLDQYNTSGYAYDIALDGDHLYLADGADGWLLFDVTDPADLRLMHTADTPDIASGVALDGENLLVGDRSSGVLVFEAAARCGLPAVGWTSGLNLPMDVVIDGDLCLVADAAGLQVFDFSDPVSPSLLGSHPMSISGQLAISGNLVCIAARTSLGIVDIENPALPVERGHLYAGLVAQGIDVSGDLVVMTFSDFPDDKLKCFDISDPGHPVSLGSYTSSRSLGDLKIVGEVVYVATSLGLETFDISDPSNPVPLCANYYGSPEALAVAGDRAYTVQTNRLDVWDITDPASLDTIASITFAGELTDVQVSGNTLLIVDRSGSLLEYDVSDPAAPYRIEERALGQDPFNLALAGDFAILTDHDGGSLASVIFRQRRMDPLGVHVRSTVVGTEAEPITRVVLGASQTDSVGWEISSNGGVDWTAYAPAADGVRIEEPGTDLLWRASLVYVGRDLLPSCSDLGLEWYADAALWDTLADVPDDQGGWLRLGFRRSAWDFVSEQASPATAYYVWQRVDEKTLDTDGPTGPGLDPEAADLSGLPLVRRGERIFLDTASDKAAGFPPGVWEAVGSVPAMQSDRYQVRVPTLADSLSSVGPVWSVYVVSVHTTQPAVWAVSRPDSGYSIDNIAPGVPSSLSVAYSGTGNLLEWSGGDESDFQFFRIYRGTEPDFDPGSQSPVAETVDRSWTDPAGGWQVHYRVSAVDHAGNESEAAMPEQLSGVISPAPGHVSLLQNTPNPFNPQTVISFEVPTAQKIMLRIFDAQGALVRNLLAGEIVPVGRHEVVWNGRDEANRAVASGVYFYRLDAAAFTQTRRMTLLK